MDTLLALSHSEQVAAFEVAAGDDVAAATALRRLLDSLAALRAGLPADGPGAGDSHLLDGASCFALAKLAFLSEGPERDARASAAVAICRAALDGRSMDAQGVVDYGSRLLRIERSSE